MRALKPPNPTMAVLKQVVPLEKSRAAKKQEIDFKSFIFLMSFGRYYGAIPLGRHKNKYRRIICRFIILALLLLFVVQEFLSLQTPDSILGLLQIIWQVTDTCFLYSSVYQANFYASGDWDLLLTYLRAMEELVTTLGFRSPDSLLAICAQISSIWGFSLALIAWNVFFLIQDRTDGLPDFTSYSWLIVNVYVTNFITLIFLLTRILRQRYRHINNKIEKQLRKNDLDGAFVTDFENTVKLLKTMHEVVKHMNIIFGWQFFFFVNIMIIRVVHSCFVAVFFLNPSNPGKQVETIIYAAALILIVLPCDYLEETGRIIVKTCYTMHLSTVDERTKDRLLDLGRYAGDWKPTLSAAGFFDIKKECLNSAFETFVTYLVVSIQFKMSLDSPEN